MNRDHDYIREAEMLEKLGEWFIQFGIRLKAWAKEVREKKESRSKDVNLELLSFLVLALRPFGFHVPLNVFLQFQVPKKIRGLSLIKGGKDFS